MARVTSFIFFFCFFGVKIALPFSPKTSTKPSTRPVRGNKRSSSGREAGDPWKELSLEPDRPVKSAREKGSEDKAFVEDDKMGVFAQELSDSKSSLLISGYADIIFNLKNLADPKTASFENSHLIMILGKTISDWLFFEFEVEYEENSSSIKLEYVVLDILLHSAATIRAGMFLVPFGRFNEYFHPSPFNKLVTNPLAMRELIPTVWRDVGIQLRGYVSLNRNRQHRLYYTAYICNGLEQSPGDNTLQVPEGGKIRPMRGYALDKYHWDKAYGARIELELFHYNKLQNLPYLLFGTSFYRGAYTVDGSQFLNIFGLHTIFSWGKFSLLGEGVVVLETTSKGNIFKWGGYLQLSYQIFKFLELATRGDIAFFGRAEELSPKFPAEDDRFRWVLGLRTAIHKNIFIKLEYDFTKFLEKDKLRHDLFLLLALSY